jgi:hypothetical protein
MSWLTGYMICHGRSPASGSGALRSRCLMGAVTGYITGVTGGFCGICHSRQSGRVTSMCLTCRWRRSG